MLPSFFASDLHGQTGRYVTLFSLVREEKPRGLFLGGDLLPHAMDSSWTSSDDQEDFLLDFVLPELRKLRDDLGEGCPQQMRDDLPVGKGAVDPCVHRTDIALSGL